MPTRSTNLYQNRILRLPEVEKQSGLKKTAIYKKIGEGTFPAPVRLSVRAVGWTSESINDWLNNLQPTVEQ